MSAFFEVSGLRAGYGRVNVLKDLSLRVDKGSIISVVGPNGAGKTTTLNALMGLRASQGAITLDGRRIDMLSPESRLEAGLCLISERRELFSTMSVEDNLKLGAFCRRRERSSEVRKTYDHVLDLFPRLRERLPQYAGTLSGGERQMLAIGRALMSKPRLLMMDEPSLGLAPLIVSEMFRIITNLRDEGVSILLVEQNARAALAISERAYVLELGEIAMEGPSSDLANEPKVIEAYLGAGIGARSHGEHVN